MSECTTCSYYGRHLDGRAEDMPWPCVECEGGEKYVERGKRRHRVPLRVQLAAILASHNALREAVAWEREFDEVLVWLVQTGRYPRDMGGKYDLAAERDCARSEVDRLIRNQ